MRTRTSTGLADRSIISNILLKSTTHQALGDKDDRQRSEPSRNEKLAGERYKNIITGTTIPRIVIQMYVHNEENTSLMHPIEFEAIRKGFLK